MTRLDEFETFVGGVPLFCSIAKIELSITCGALIGSLLNLKKRNFLGTWQEDITFSSYLSWDPHLNCLYGGIIIFLQLKQGNVPPLVLFFWCHIQHNKYWV
jgi:hypothetical protein